MAAAKVASRASRPAAGFTEVLLHQLKALPKQPFLMWVTAAWKDFEYGRAHSAEAEHLSILRRYDVPHLSVLQAVTPPIDATTETKDAITRFLYRIYFADCCHPTRTGHKIIAALVVRRLLLQLVETPSRSWFVSSSEAGSSAGASLPDPHLQVGSMRHSYQMGEDAFVTSRARTMVPILFSVRALQRHFASLGTHKGVTRHRRRRRPISYPACRGAPTFQNSARTSMRW